MNKYVICDIDETLVYGRRVLPDSIKFFSEGFNMEYTKPRPGAHLFLQQLQSKGYKIISVTQGVVWFQKEVLEACNLLQYFEEIYGWYSTSRTRVIYPPTLDKFVMVDNLAHDDFVLSEKMAWLGREFDPEINFIQCEEYLGIDNVPCLTSYIPRIEELLNKA